jgi:hypothetical protein
MVLAGILLLACSFLCVLSVLLKYTIQKKLNHTIILSQGILSILLFFWSLLSLFILIVFEGETIINNFGIVFFLSALFSYTIIFAVSLLLTIAFIQKLSEYNLKQADTNMTFREWHSKLITIHIPLGILCFIIGVWDIIYVTSLHSVITHMMQLQ